jgi:adenylate kinase
MRRLVMLGPPASGKGTQGRRLAARIGAPHVSTGALLRATIVDGDPLGVAQLIAEGNRVPDEIVEKVLAPALGDEFVLDGYPRTARQAERLDQLIVDRPLGRAVELFLDDAALCARMFLRADTEHRADDSPEVFLHRLEDYQREAPAIRRQYGDRIVLVDASGDEDEVFDRMLHALGLEPVRV